MIERQFGILGSQVNNLTDSLDWPVACESRVGRRLVNELDEDDAEAVDSLGAGLVGCGVLKVITDLIVVSSRSEGVRRGETTGRAKDIVHRHKERPTP